MIIIFATGNKDKLREIREIADRPGIRVLSMKEAGLFTDPAEDGSTFAENALIKAHALADALTPGRLAEIRAYCASRSGLVGGSAQDPVSSRMEAAPDGSDDPVVVLSDDSGLCIDALDGAPGVQSARYMGHETSYEIKNAAILDLMRDVPEERRGAQFVCAVAAVLPDGSDHVETGVMEGQVAYEVSGNGGFGYDPLFYLPEYGMTSADITEEQKNAISHRGKALRQMMVYLAGEGLCEY